MSREQPGTRHSFRRLGVVYGLEKSAAGDFFPIR
jgi:hypothetical protein